MMRRLISLFVAFLALAGPVYVLAEQSATVLRDTDLLSEPFSDASVIGSLKAKATLTLFKRQGGWYQVQVNDRQGWVRMSAIRPGEAQTGGSTGIGETLRLLHSGRSGASGVTVATGIRGLDSADMANVTPNHQAVKHLAQYQVPADRARAFAAEAELKSNELAYLEAKGNASNAEDPWQ